MTDKIGSLEWVEEPIWIGPRDETEHLFSLLTAAASAATFVLGDEVAEYLAKQAGEILLDSIDWVYWTNNYDPESFGLPSREEYEAQSLLDSRLSKEELAQWAYDQYSEARKEQYWLGIEIANLRKRQEKLNDD